MPIEADNAETCVGRPCKHLDVCCCGGLRQNKRLCKYETKMGIQTTRMQLNSNVYHFVK